MAGTVEEKWEVMKSALCDAARSTLGTSSRKKVDWFEENAGVLTPMLRKRKEAYLKWLDTGNERERKNFAELRRKAREVARDAKIAGFSERRWRLSMGCIEAR